MGTKRYSPEFKLEAIRKARAAASIPALSAELGVHYSQLYRWLKRFGEAGAEGLITPAAPRLILPSAADPLTRVAALERKIGQQAADLDFLKRAFKRVKEPRPNSESSGAAASTK